VFIASIRLYVLELAQSGNPDCNDGVTGLKIQHFNVGFLDLTFRAGYRPLPATITMTNWTLASVAATV